MNLFSFRDKCNLYYEERSDYNMILFITLCLIAIAIAVISVLLLAAGGAAFTIVFGDLIVCVFLIILLIKAVFGRKDK